jgi:four helix bundle protein
MQDFRKIDAWRKGHELALDVHRTLARHRRIDAHMRSQMLRAARAIPANLVEGCGKNSQAELARFTDIAIGSCSELEYWILTARDLGYFSAADFERLTAATVEVRKMLFGFRRTVRSRLNEGKAGIRPSKASVDARSRQSPDDLISEL